MSAARGVRFFSALAGAATAVACGGALPPPELAAVDAIAASAAARAAAEDAPQATAEAERLRQEAGRVAAEGDAEATAIAAERAVAAFEESFAQARAVRAAARSRAAETHITELEAELAKLEAESARATADAEAYELRAQVALDLEPLRDVEKPSAERARARRQAAVQLTAEARLLCLATALLSPEAAGLAGPTEQVSRLEAELAAGGTAEDLYPRAAAARTACLTALSGVRRAPAQRAPELPGADGLLASLTETGRLFAYRDDRGVVVNLVGAFDDKLALTPAAAEAVRLLGAASRQHADHPLLVVGHAARREKLTRTDEQVALLAKALEGAGAAKVRTHVVGTAQPVVLASAPGADARNSRLEVIFVTPAR
jgi:SWI/SNF-related matrix-associated actin-dependent regulator 1 of chromatin subfamily A